MNFNKRNRVISSYVSIFFFSIIIQTIFPYLLSEKDRNSLTTDFITSYNITANNLLDGQGINAFYIDSNKINKSFPNKLLQVNHPPGYPVIIYAIYVVADFLNLERINLLKDFETFIYALSSLFIFILLRMFFTFKHCYLASLIWSIYPFNLWFSKQPCSEVLFTLLLILSIYYFLKHLERNHFVYLILYSFTISLSIFIRSIAIFLPFIFLFIYIYKIKILNNLKPKKINLIFTILLPYLIISPWILFISIENQKFIPMTDSGNTMIISSLSHLVEKNPNNNHVAPKDVRNMINETLKDFKSSDSNEHEILKIINYSLFNYPIESAKLFLIKFARSFYATYSKRDENKIFYIQFFYLLTIISGLIISKSIKSLYSIFSILFLFYSITICIITFPILRYIVPSMGFLSIFSAIFFEKIFTTLKDSIYEKTS